MSFDTTLPEQLKKTQQWFASIITRPIDENSQMNSVSPSGRPMSDEASDWIAPSSRLTSDQRIQIYNQQYWWRFLSTLHDTFPLLTRLFGYNEFNEKIGVPYLDKYHANHWSLNLLGNRLSQWVTEEYRDEDKPLILNAASVDWAYTKSFFSAHHPFSGDAEKTAYLQPHIELFSMPYDLFSFRMEFIKEDPDYWLTHTFPEIQKGKTFYFILWRNGKNAIVYDELSSCQYQLLQQFQNGATIETACDWLAKQDASLVEEASQNLHQWMQEWTYKQWLYYR